MAEVTLSVRGPGVDSEVQLDPAGLVLGRSERCDVVINSKDVSRQHARVFRDPFGRWILEDMCSSNGTFVSGRRVEVCPISPGEVAEIGPVSLWVNEAADVQVEADEALDTANVVVEDFETEVFTHKGGGEASPAEPFPEQLGEIRRRLSEITSLSVLYPEVCRVVASPGGTVAAVLRVPRGGGELPKTPDVLACHFGTSPDDTIGRFGPGRPSHLAFRVSLGLLEAVRSSGEPVMSKSIYSSDTEVTITAVDEHSPRAAICASMGQSGDSVDLLYLDLPISRSTSGSLGEAFAFGRIVAGEVASARENLVPMHLKSERNALDRELWLAQQIQRRLSPSLPKLPAGLDGAVVYRPVIWVGGDFCDIWPAGEGQVAFAVGAIGTRGLKSAMGLSTLRTLLRSTMSFCDEPAKVLEHVNEHLTASHPDGIEGSLLLGVLDVSTWELAYVSAGHPAPVMLHPRAGVRALGEAGEGSLGVGEMHLRTESAVLEEGAFMAAFSGGVVDARSGGGEVFGIRRLFHVLKEGGIEDADSLGGQVSCAVDEFRGSAAQQLDMSLIALHRLPGQK